MTKTNKEETTTTEIEYLLEEHLLNGDTTVHRKFSDLNKAISSFDDIRVENPNRSFKLLKRTNKITVEII